MGFFSTFRGRLLIILAFLIVATLGVQYYVNLLTQNENNRLREEQEQTIVAGISVGISSLTSSDDRVADLINEPGQTFLDQDAKERIKDIIVIDNQWRITDSINPEYLPTEGPDGEIIYRSLQSVKDLPPLLEGSRLGADLEKFPNRKRDAGGSSADEAHAIPIETSQGRWYVMVLLKNDRSEAARRAAQPLLATLAILGISTLLTILLVWRFTRPISDLSNAAREVAAGNLSVRVPSGGRADEMGSLAQNFNEMTAELEKTRELEGKLQQAEKSAVIGRLGSAIAHEIRNPLNYINLTLDHLRTKFAPAGDEKKAEAFAKLTSQLKSEVARINQQISDFLNYSRPANVSLRPIDLRETIEASLRIVEAQAAENNIKIALIESGSVPNAMGDPEFLRSVFNNLFINAVQAMGSEGGHLQVKISAEEPNVRIDISDTGDGISEENLAKVFEPYFSTKETGTGLGLAIVQKIVDLHNGTIEVSSTEGQGTKFTVHLPSTE